MADLVNITKVDAVENPSHYHEYFLVNRFLGSDFRDPFMPLEE